MTRTPLRVAVVGLGEAGATLHLPALAKVPAAAVVGACDADAARREAAARRWGIPGFADLETMLGTLKPDVVTIATPPESHAALCLEALAAGSHVFCEKPFMCTLQEADRVLAAATAAGRRIAVNHEFREMPIFRALIDAVRSGRDGDVRCAQAWQHVDMPPWRESGWRGALARRTLFEAGVHQIDWLLALFDESPRAVHAVMSAAGVPEETRDALVTAILEFSRGRMAVLTLNRVAKGAPQYFEGRVDLERATYRASFGGRARASVGLLRSARPHLRLEFGAAGIAWREVGHERRPLARNSSSPNVAATRRVFVKAFEDFETPDPANSNTGDARRAMAVVEACYTSAETGRRVSLL